MQVQVQANDRMKLEVHGSVKIRRKVHSSATTGQGSDKSTLEVHGSVRALLKVKNSYNIRLEVHSSATAGAIQCQNDIRGAR